MKLNIHISPVKAILSDFRTDEDWIGVAAVFVTSYDEATDLPSDNCICLGFADVGSTADVDAITPDDAEKIKEFVLGLGDDTEDLFFCCDRGESRSAALACAFMRYYGQDEMKIWSDADYHPNMLVYFTMCEALELPCPEMMQKELSDINEEALKSKIRKARS